MSEELKAHLRVKIGVLVVLKRLKKIFKIKRSPKSKGYQKFLTESEQRQVYFNFHFSYKITILRPIQ